MSIHKMSLTAKTQANGAQVIDLTSNNQFTSHQIQIEVSDQPSAGTLAIGVKTPGATVYYPIETAYVMTGITATAAAIIQFSGQVEAFQFTPTNFDADKTYSIYLVSK